MLYLLLQEAYKMLNTVNTKNQNCLALQHLRKYYVFAVFSSVISFGCFC